MANERSLDDLVSALQSSFLIDDYLELRRRFPEADSPLWMIMASDNTTDSFGLDFAYQLEKDFERFQIPIELYLGVLDGDSDNIDLLCLTVLEALSRREKLETKNPHAVAANLAIGDAMVDFLCGAILESISYYGLKLPHSYQILLKYRLGLFHNSIKEDRILKHRRVMVALTLAENPGASARTIAKRTGLSPSTITRWMSNDDFRSYVKMFRAHPPR